MSNFEQPTNELDPPTPYADHVRRASCESPQKPELLQPSPSELIDQDWNNIASATPKYHIDGTVKRELANYNHEIELERQIKSPMTSPHLGTHPYKSLQHETIVPQMYQYHDEMARQRIEHHHAYNPTSTGNGGYSHAPQIGYQYNHTGYHHPHYPQGLADPHQRQNSHPQVRNYSYHSQQSAEFGGYREQTHHIQNFWGQNEHSQYSLLGVNNANSRSPPEAIPDSTGGKSKKKERTSFSKTQVDQLEEDFLRNNYLTRLRRYELAVKLDLTERQIKVWFQNRRMKWKRQSTVPPTRANGNSNLSSPNTPDSGCASIPSTESHRKDDSDIASPSGAWNTSWGDGKAISLSRPAFSINNRENFAGNSTNGSFSISNIAFSDNKTTSEMKTAFSSTTLSLVGADDSPRTENAVAVFNSQTQQIV